MKGNQKLTDEEIDLELDKLGISKGTLQLWGVTYEDIDSLETLYRIVSSSTFTSLH